MSDQVKRQKQEFRVQMKEKLKNMTCTDYTLLNEKVLQRFFELSMIKQARKIMIYYSIEREVATIPMIERLLQQDKQVYLPICRADKDLDAGLITGLEGLVERKFKLKEPAPGGIILSPEELEVIVIPGLAFDRKGYRLGHGVGYYDRFLVKTHPKSRKIGLAYDFQVISQLPADGYDIPVNGILTPNTWLDFVI